MSERSVVITEENGTYKIHNFALSEFELLGLFEQIVFDLKYSRAGKSPRESDSTAGQNPEPVVPTVELTPPATSKPPVEDEQSDSVKAVAPERIAGVISSAATDLRTRIGNAVKAIRDLGGRVETADLSKMTDEELQNELEELTAQYKRLKNSKGSGK